MKLQMSLNGLLSSSQTLLQGEANPVTVHKHQMSHPSMSTTNYKQNISNPSNSSLDLLTPIALHSLNENISKEGMKDMENTLKLTPIPMEKVG